MNMKKIALATAVTASILSANIFAAGFAIKPGKHIESIAGGAANAEDKCNKLAENVVINLSKGVNGAYDCGLLLATQAVIKKLVR